MASISVVNQTEGLSKFAPVLNHLYVFQFQLGCLGINHGCSLCIYKGGVAQRDSMYTGEAFYAIGTDGGTGATADDIGNMDVRKLGHIFRFGCINRSCLFGGRTSRTVHIITLEDNCFISDVVHHDVADVYILGLATPAYTTLETQPGVCSGKTALAHYYPFHARHIFTANDKTAMSMINRIVLYQNILASIHQCLRFRLSTFHTDTIISGIHRRVDNQSTVTVTQVNGIAVLGIPRTSHGNAVNDDVTAVDRMHMETGRILEGNTLYQYVLTLRKAQQVCTLLLLCFWSVGDVGIAGFDIPWVPE